MIFFFNISRLETMINMYLKFMGLLDVTVALQTGIHTLISNQKYFQQNPPNVLTKVVLRTLFIAFTHNLSTLRPDCVLFTESLPSDQWSGAERSVRDLQQGDVMLIVGTSATVYPAAALPEYASKRGAHLIDVNLQPTAFNSLENYHFLGGSAATSLPALVKRVKEIRGIADTENTEEIGVTEE
jgi:NAD-dependent SIR2 family protein deacetylase